ncbi:hypothetical protein EJ05DRAFT_52727 [Pseudovirgaria hyperparasitica]|uniref:Increased loss of mitochondrial DNA protein 1 n=1 Tax=Pseudovirgaria hyperparasitica TaxID=470096 RepID=A0A6A6W395_9PEZI|nr:uncharacterized protein EJ05DRAFT_52727 [Pseudovirgaria hyperparasitica]KAF2757035.1 hypothetical protein EJ05DRAFT_52727 [Pseudovirgaria hyperparasitica]
MAIFTSSTIIRLTSILHLTIAYYLLVSPKTVADQNFVYMLGEAMGIPQVTAFNKASPVTALLAVLFAFLGLSDFVAASINEEASVAYWSAQTPVRLIFLFIISGYTYLFKRGGILSAKGVSYRAGAGDELKNSVVFGWAFVEITAWFWVRKT